MWYSHTVTQVVATVSTVVNIYRDTARTSYVTVANNNTLPSTLFSYNEYIFPGIPTELVSYGGPYGDGQTILITGTVFTDPYGVAHTSPTPVLYVSDVSVDYGATLAIETYSYDPTYHGVSTECRDTIDVRYITVSPAGKTTSSSSRQTLVLN
jgi:hypothetical protein